MMITNPATSDARDGRERAEHELRAAAEEVVRRGLAAPAVFFLELYKPMTGVLQAGAVMAAPLAAMLFGTRRTDGVIRLLESREQVEQLIVQIEQAQQRTK